MLHHTRFIQIIFAFLFCVITTSAFALSYVNLTAAAIEAGIIPTLAPLWPLCLDAFIVMGSLFVLQANLNHEPSWPGWITLLCFTVVSTGFNIAHSSPGILSQSAHALPPIALCASLELLMIRIKRDLLASQRVTEDRETPLSLSDQISQEKVLKVREWFTVNPGGTIEQARKALGMGWSTVRDCREYLINSGQLTGLTE
jgi:hypothetical protein